MLLIFFMHTVINHLEETDTSPIPQTSQTQPKALESATASAASVSVDNSLPIMFTTNIPAAISPVYLTTSIITVKVTASSDTIFQPNNDNCTPAVIVVPIMVTFIAIVVITVVVVVAIWCRRSENKRSLTTKLNSVTCVVENDLYQLVSCVLASCVLSLLLVVYNTIIALPQIVTGLELWPGKRLPTHYLFKVAFHPGL